MLVNFSLAVWYLVTSGDLRGFFSHQLFTPLLAISYLLLGVAISRQRPRNSIGWLLLIVGVCYALSALAAGTLIYGPALPVSFPQSLVDLAEWLNIWVWLPAQMLPITFVLLLFPDGHPPSPRWRTVAWITGAGLGLTMLCLAFLPGPLAGWGTPVNPFGVAQLESVLTPLLTLGTTLLLAGMVGCMAAVIMCYRCADGLLRQQMKWLTFAVLVVIVLLVVGVLMALTTGAGSSLTLELSIVLSNLGTLALAAAVTVAVVGYRLYDIDLIINRTLVYAVMTGLIIAVYALVVGGSSLFFQTQTNWLVALVATGVVAVLFQPVRDRLQRGVNRLLYGQRDEPFDVLAELGARLEQSISSDAVYPAIVDTITQTLKLPYAAIEAYDGRRFVTVESMGDLTPSTELFELTYQGATVGRLRIGHRSPDETFSPADQRLLRTLAQQAGAAVYDAQLTADLQRSRQELVASREEERRRLRRDLHDGLGPSLASLLLEARVLRRIVRSDPEAAEALADEMQGDIRETIEEIRRVVHELRPPALDDLGLVAAIQLMAARIGRDAGRAPGELTVTVDSPDDLPPLPAAVEVVTYRIVQEALANVAHHADASAATVRLWLANGLYVEIDDNGRGYTGPREGGLGLLSMRERAEELGGRWAIMAKLEGGTRVSLWLPLPETNSL